MKKASISESEFRFAQIVWENEPISSGDLVKLCDEKLQWKKSTTYTVLKKLCDKKVLKNENAQVSSIISKEEIQHNESKEFISKFFSGSLPNFVTAFSKDKKMSKKEIEELEKLIQKLK